MVNEYKPRASDPASRQFVPKEFIDCCDRDGRWLNAEVLEASPDQLRVHFTGFHHKFDEVIPNTPERVLKQCTIHTGRMGQDFLLNQRIDVLDTFGKWLETRVIDKNDTQIKVHYRNFHEKFDEWLHKSEQYTESDRIREIGTYSSAAGIGKIDPLHPSKIATKQLQPEIRAPKLAENKELRFRQLLAQKGFLIQEVEADGNCLFRAVSHQLYGSTQHHGLIRATCIAYLDIEREYFSQFVVDGLEKFDSYLQYKATNGAWGDDVELQAISEIYNRPIEIYAYANTPLRTFHERSNFQAPLRLAYHGESHYNSVVSQEFHPLFQTQTGEVEREFLEHARQRNMSRLALDDDTIRSRETFDTVSQHALQEALLVSLQDSEDPSLQDVLRSSMLDATESQLVHQALEESSRDHPRPTEDEEMRMALAMSMEEQQIHPAVVQAMDMGFSMEQVIEAMSLVGDAPDVVVEYLLSTLK